MPRIMRAVVNWSGFPGAPGYSVFHASQFSADPTSEAQTFSTAVRTLMIAVAPSLPSAASMTMSGEVSILEDTTDTLEEVISVDPGVPIPGATAGAYAGASGGIINWSTSTIRNGRRMRGRTFLVPFGQSSFDTSGTLAPAAVTRITDAAVAYFNTPEILPVIYGRPTLIGNDGVSGPITSARVPDLAAVLRSRRD